MKKSFKKQFLIMAIGLFFCSTPLAMAENRFKLSSDLLGEFGTVTEPMENLIKKVLNEFGMAKAATDAKNSLGDLVSGQIPIMNKLQDPFQGNVEDRVAAALADAQIAFDIMSNVTGPAIQTALGMLEADLISDADFGITLPTGRVKVYKKGPEISICITTVGPLGIRITTGISNAENLCNNPAPRMANESRALTLFTDIAVGYTHVQTRQIVIPSQDSYTKMSPSLVAETYVNINGQWVQIRLAGADPESVEMTAEFEVGLKVGYNAELMLEAGYSAVLSIGVKPAYADHIINETLEVMTQAADGQDPLADVLDNAAAIVKAGLDHLQTFNQGPDYAGELGKVSLVLGTSAEIGVGIWDTGIAGLSAGSSITTTLSLESLVNAGSDFYSQLLESSFNLSKPIRDLFKALMENELTDEHIETLFSETGQAIDQAATDMVGTTLKGLLEMSTDLEMEFGFEITALGGTSESQKNSIPVMEGGIKLPTGDVIDTIANDPEALGRALNAALNLGLSALKPEISVNWSDLTYGIADGIEYSFMSMLPHFLVNVGFSEVKLIDLLEMMESNYDYIQPILVGVIQSGSKGSITPLRTAVENAIDQLDEELDERYLQLVKSPRLAVATGFGANGELGAEGVLKLGGGRQARRRCKGQFASAFGRPKGI